MAAMTLEKVRHSPLVRSCVYVFTAGKSESGTTEKGNLGRHSNFQSPFSPADVYTGISVVSAYLLFVYFFYLALIRGSNKKE